MSPQNESAESLGQFYDFIWGSEHGYVYLPTKSETGEWKKVMYEWPKGREKVIQHTLMSSAAGKDVYFAPAIFSSPATLKENVKGSNVLWADFDGSAPQDWAPETQESAVPPPSLRIQSSTEDHQHVYWRLDEFVNDISFIEEKNRSLAYTLRADTSGWDANQILRPPYTTNYKHNLPVVVAEEREEVYSSTRFGFLKAPKQLVRETLSLDALVPIEEILAKYPWDSEHFERFKTDDPPGDRSAALMELGYFGCEVGMSDEEVFSILVHADDRWGKFTKRNDRLRRLSDIINRARQKHPHSVSDLTFAGLSGTQEISTDRQYVFGFDDFTHSEFKVEWLVEGLLQRAGIALISAAGGVGKTQVTYQLGCHLALGRNFLGWVPVRQINAMLLSLEMGPSALKTFHLEIAAGYSPEEITTLQEKFKLVPLGEPIYLDKPEGRRSFEYLISTYEPEVLMIDSLGKMVAGDIKDDNVMRLVFNYLSTIRAKFGTSFWIIHHNRKGTGDNKRPRELSDVYGSQYITSEVDLVLTLWKNHGEEDIEVREPKNRLAPQRDDFVIKRIENLKFEIKTDTPEAFQEPLQKKGQDINDEFFEF